MYSRANQDPQSISLTTKTSVYLNLVVPPLSVEKPMNYFFFEQDGWTLILQAVLIVGLVRHKGFTTHPIPDSKKISNV